MCIHGGFTANPQKENGSLSIANELVEVLAKTQLNGYESRILWSVWRKTYCWHKKEDWIAFSQFRELTGLADSHISRTLKRLIDRHILTKNGKSYAFNKDYEQWVKLPKMVSRVTKNGKSHLPKLADTNKTHTNKTITKLSTNVDRADSPQAEYGDPNVNRLYREFEELIAPIVEKKKRAREKLKILIAVAKGIDNASKVIRIAAMANTERYGPKVGRPEDLLDKYGRLAIWAKGKAIEEFERNKKHVVI